MKTKLILSGLTGLLILCSTNTMAAKPSTDKEKFSYALGFQIGQGFKRDGLDVDLQAMSAAIADVLAEKAPQITIAEMRGAMEQAQKELVAKRQQMGEKAKAAGQAFLETNKKKPGVVTLPSGMQYKVITAGSGKQPTATSSITAHYKGTLIDGKEFDSSYRRGEPATFPVNQVIQGWQEILPMMHEGDTWQVYIPSDMAYGESGSPGGIGPNETLIFDIELIKVN